MLWFREWTYHHDLLIIDTALHTTKHRKRACCSGQKKSSNSAERIFELCAFSTAASQMTTSCVCRIVLMASDLGEIGNSFAHAMILVVPHLHFRHQIKDSVFLNTRTLEWGRDSSETSEKQLHLNCSSAIHCWRQAISCEASIQVVLYEFQLGFLAALRTRHCKKKAFLDQKTSSRIWPNWTSESPLQSLLTSLTTLRAAYSWRQIIGGECSTTFISSTSQLLLSQRRCISSHSVLQVMWFCHLHQYSVDFSSNILHNSRPSFSTGVEWVCQMTAECYCFNFSHLIACSWARLINTLLTPRCMNLCRERMSVSATQKSSQ